MRILLMTTMAAMTMAAITVSAQPAASSVDPAWSVGPQVGYTVALSTPAQVSQSGAPSRFTLGALATRTISEKMQLRFAAAYRSESGSFTTPVTSAGTVSSEGASNRSWLDVVDPTTGGPAIGSTVSTSAAELMASMMIPVANLDTSGARLLIGVSVLADVLLTGRQEDDYSDVPNHTGADVRTFEYSTHVGAGAALGIGLVLPVSDGVGLLIDAQYVFREPREIRVSEQGVELPDAVDVSWLVGRGLRLSAAVTFDL